MWTRDTLWCLCHCWARTNGLVIWCLFFVGLQKLLMTIKTFGWKWGHQSYSNGGAVVTVPPTIYTIIGLLRTTTSILAIFCCKGLGRWIRLIVRHWAIDGLNIQSPTFPIQLPTTLIQVVVSWWKVGAGTLLGRYFCYLADLWADKYFLGNFLLTSRPESHFPVLLLPSCTPL